MIRKLIHRFLSIMEAILEQHHEFERWDARKYANKNKQYD